MGQHSLRKAEKPLSRQDIINLRRKLLAIHRKMCKGKKCTCSLAEMDLPTIPND